MSTTRRSPLSVLLALALLALAPATHAARRVAKYQEGYFRDLPGIDPQRIYNTILPSDHVDVWAGTLVLTQPLWSAPQKGDLTLELALVYTSTNWDNREWGGWDNPETPGQDIPPHKWSRARESWVHPGWSLCLGRIAKAPHFENGGAAPQEVGL